MLFRSSEKISIKINKIWNDDNNTKRPESIKVKVLANGNVIAYITLTKENGWTYTLDNLYKYENQKEIKYTLLEDKVEGYETTYNGFDIINTLTQKYDNIEIIPPQTGDENTNNTNIIFILLGLLSLSLALKKAYQ